MAQPIVFKVVKGRRVPDDHKPSKGEKVKYRFVVDIGTITVTDKKTGKPKLQRKQKTHTYNGKREAEKALSKILSEVNGGTFVIPAKTTLNDLCEEWLRSKRGKAVNTIAAYTNGLKPARERLGEKPAQKVSVKDVNDLMDWMLTSGRKRGGQPGTGLGPRSAAITLAKLRAVYAWAMKQTLVTNNPAAMVDMPEQDEVEREPWSTGEVREFLASLDGERLLAPMQLSLMGLRPAEVCGLRWTDIDLDAETLKVANTRTLTWGDEGGRVVEKAPKSKAGKRELPLPGFATAALRTFKATQARERLAAGKGYEPSGYVLCDELGRPCRTDWLRRRAYELMAAAGTRQVRLYDARHACLTHLRMSGVPGPIVSAWAGHADLTTTDRNYVHPSAEDLKQGRDKLGEMYG